MLKSLTVTNFQCHRNLTLEFVPGVNVIAGTSDVGKSAVLKAMLWVLTNRPQGIAFRSWACAKDEDVSVKLVLDDFTITRWRSEKGNEYVAESTDDQKPTRYVAMRTDVPAELDDLFNMGPVNIQTQFQPHFLLSASSAEVARVLNEACDLSVIDKVVRAINDVHNKAKAAAYSAKQDLARLEEEHAKLAWADAAQDLLASAKAEDARIRQREEAVTALQTAIDGLLAANKRKKDVERRQTAFWAVDAASEQVADVARQQDECQGLGRLVEDITTLDVRHSFLRLRQLPQDDLDQLAGMLPILDKYTSRIEHLQPLCSALAKLDRQLSISQSRRDAIQQELDALWASVDVCPLCGQALEAKHEC